MAEKELTRIERAEETLCAAEDVLSGGEIEGSYPFDARDVPLLTNVLLARIAVTLERILHEVP